VLDPAIGALAMLGCAALFGVAAIHKLRGLSSFRQVFIAYELLAASIAGRLCSVISPTCPVCKSLLPVVKSRLRSERLWLDILLASDGNLAEQRAYIQKNALTDLTYVLSTDLGMSFQVSRLPYAALVGQQGVLRARGLVNSREHLESLFEAKRLGVSSLQEYFAGKAEAA
jgi:methylamine dehydrogenase accessory protein MauD